MSGRFFVMVCKKRTEDECLSRSLFGGTPDFREWYSKIHIGDTGFLLNLDTGSFVGPFEALSPAIMNIEPDAWDGRYLPEQVTLLLVFDECSVVVFLESDPQFFLCVHHDRAVPRDRFTNRLT